MSISISISIYIHITHLIHGRRHGLGQDIVNQRQCIYTYMYKYKYM